MQWASNQISLSLLHTSTYKSLHISSNIYHHPSWMLCIREEPLTLWCLIDGDSSPFQIQGSPHNNISHLQAEIYQKNPRLHDVGVSYVNIWKVWYCPALASCLLWGWHHLCSSIAEFHWNHSTLYQCIFHWIVRPVWNPMKNYQLYSPKNHWTMISTSSWQSRQVKIIPVFIIAITNDLKLLGSACTCQRKRTVRQ